MVEAGQAMAAMALGDAAGARDTARRVLDSGTRNFTEEPALELVAMLDALVALEDWDAIRAFLAEARARSGYVAMVGPTADRTDGLARAAAGSTAEAIDLLDRAIESFDRLSVFDAARTREALAGVDPTRRTELLEAALATYVRLGAAPAAARVQSTLDGER